MIVMLVIPFNNLTNLFKDLALQKLIEYGISILIK
jgi:hypothetical protein